MRIAESYFRQLLFETPVIEAVHALLSNWEQRASEGSPCFGLAVPEYSVTLSMIYSGEVGNGGHQQFFSNRGGRHVADTLTALASVGLVKPRDILRRACTVFPEARVPADRVVVDALLNTLSSRSWEFLSALDREFWAIKDVDETVLAYLRSCHSELLLPERGLAGGEAP